jgi:hypothetical protein
MRFPVWVYAFDEECEPGQDEATVKPWEKPLPFNPGEGLNVVRADFWLADGTYAIGHLSAPVSDLSEIGYIQPTIVTPRGQVNFWCGTVKPDAGRLRVEYDILGKIRSQVFPLRYESAVDITTGKIAGVIKGFMYYGSIEGKTIELVN